MKIGIPSDDGHNISMHFGRCMYFVVYEVDDTRIKSWCVRDNIYCPHRTGICPRTMGDKDKDYLRKHRESVLFELKDCQLVIGRFINKVLKANLEEKKIRYIVVDERIAEEAVRKYLLGTLPMNESDEDPCAKQKCNCNCF